MMAVGETVASGNETRATLDRSVLDSLTDGDLEFRNDLLQTFLDSAPESMCELNEAVVHGDLAQTLYHAHTLKGSCRAIGAVDAAEAALVVETASREGQIDRLKPLAVELAASLQRLNELIRSLLAE